MNLRAILLPVFLMFVAVMPSRAGSYNPAPVTPPEPTREFRGMWVTCIGEGSWRTNNNTADQKAALIALLDQAVFLKMNAVMFQVRPACDALYDSKIEPWSEYLTGTMGKAPEPYYDPLAFVLQEAHERGLEVHAWFNPYRALHFLNKSPVAPNHVSRAKAQYVRKYSRYLWLDPGERDVPDYTLKVVMDVVKRYDVDGVVYDDYFYPYPEKGADGKDLDFPDEASWKKYGVNSGLSRDDWRRQNVDTLVERSYRSIKAAKPWVKFGISPFGIWRPGNPESIKGLDAFGRLYADSRKWLVNGWMDYCVPQLYWPTQPKEQSFPVLLRWWTQQNVKGRHVWAGLADYKLKEGWIVEEITAQIAATRREGGSDGQVHFNSQILKENWRLGQILAYESYVEPALVPASPWLGVDRLQKPTLTIAHEDDWNLDLHWAPAPGEKPWAWVVQMKFGDVWRTMILKETSHEWQGMRPDAIAVTAVDRNGNLSPPAGLVKRPPIFPPSKGGGPKTPARPRSGHGGGA